MYCNATAISYVKSHVAAMNHCQQIGAIADRLLASQVTSRNIYSPVALIRNASCVHPTKGTTSHTSSLARRYDWLESAQ